MTEHARDESWHRQALALIDPKRGLWRILPAPLIAAVHFTICYMATSVYCIRAEEGNLAQVNEVLGWLTVATLATIGLLSWAAWRRLRLVRSSTEGPRKQRSETEFLARITWYLSNLSWLGVLFIAAPLAYFGVCA